MAALTLSEAHLELLDHLDEDVHVGIMLPGGVPWAGTHGTLSHRARHLMADATAGETFYFDDETSRTRRRWAELLLSRGGQDGLFTFDGFLVPLDAERVVTVHRTTDGRHPGLDFAIVGGLTVRVTFAEHESES
jgi:hypothetical protein